MKESIVQGAILRLVRAHPKVAWAKRMNSGRKGYVRFGFPGCSDIIGQMADGRFLAIECKAEKGAATDDQVAFLERVIRHKGVAGICRSVEDADELLRAADASPNVGGL